MTNEEVDLRVKALVKPECLIEQPPPITDLVYPQFKMMLPSSYNAPIRVNDLWSIYDVNRKLHSYSSSWSSIGEIQTNAPAGSIIKITENRETKYLGRQHYKSAFNSDYESLYSKSVNGISWTPIFRDRAIQGEDGNMIEVPSPGVIYNFVRPSRIRDLGYQTLSSTVSNNNLPSTVIRIIERNTSLSLGIKDVYCACPILLNDVMFPKFLLFVSLYRKGKLGQDVEQKEPFELNEQTVDSYLYYFDVVTMNIRALNAGNPIISRTAPQQQKYNWATLEGDTIYINSSFCMNKHVMIYPQTLTSELYTWKLSDALRFVNET